MRYTSIHETPNTGEGYAEALSKGVSYYSNLTNTTTMFIIKLVTIMMKVGESTP
jgi:hypothetical protein